MGQIIPAIALCELGEVKEYLDIKHAGADEMIKTLINAVSQDCLKYLRRSLLKATHTDETYTGDNTNVLWLRDYPIISIASITPYEGAAALTLVGTEFDFDAESGEIRLRDGRIFQSSQHGSINNVKITYDAGYDGIANLPYDLRFSIMQAVAHKHNEFDKKSYSVTRQDKGDAGSAEYIDANYPQHVTSIWRRYRRKVYA